MVDEPRTGSCSPRRPYNSSFACADAGSFARSDRFIPYFIDELPLPLGIATDRRPKGVKFPARA